MGNIGGLAWVSTGGIGRVGLPDDQPGLQRSGSTGPSTVGREVLVFDLDGREYAIDIQLVRDVRAYERPAPMANTSESVRGILHVQGETAPLVDLRSWFGLRRLEPDASKAVIVLSAAGSLVAVTVDSVSDIVQVAVEPVVKQAIEPPGSIDSSFITGIGRVGSRVVIVVDGEALVQAVDAEFRHRSA